MKLNITAENKLLLVSFGPLVLGVLFLLFLSNLSLNKITDMITNLDDKRKIESNLINKKNIIENVTSDILSQTNIITVALPETNSTLMASSQIKKYAFENNILITSVKTGGELKDKNDIKKGDISFELTGPKDLIYNLIGFLEEMLPLSKIEKIELSGSDILRAEVTLRSFWAQLPKTLPSISEKATELTDEEIDLIGLLSKYKLPIFFDVKANPQNQNPNPFGI